VEQLVRLIAMGLAFGLVVFVHEVGHFVAARLSGMAVHEFSIGFGRPRLLGFRRGETTYSFRLWPFFSYVRVAGMEPGDEHPNGYNTKSRLAQAFVLALGCIMNFALGVAIFVFIGMVLGKPVEVTKSVHRVIAGDPAAEAGIMPGDMLVGVNGEIDMSLEDIQKAIQEHPGDPITLEIERDGERLGIPITPKKVPVPELRTPEGEKVEGQPDKAELVYRTIGRIGVVFTVRTEKMGVWESVKAGFLDTFGMVLFLVKYLVGVIAGKMPLMLQGPVGVAHILYEDAQTGLTSFLGTVAALTIGIGFLNLLPIPPLDGSRLVITGIEAILRRPIDKRKENLVHLIGMSALLALLVILTYKDVVHLITGAG